MRWLSLLLTAGSAVPIGYAILDAPSGWVAAGAATVTAWAAWLLTGLTGRPGQWAAGVAIWCLAAGVVWAPVEGTAVFPWWDQNVNVWFVVLAGSVWAALAVTVWLVPAPNDEDDEPKPEPRKRRAVDRTPAPEPFVSAPPRVERIKAPVLVRLDSDEPADTSTRFDPAGDLAARVLAAWDGTKSVMHLDELAERMDRDKTLLTLDLEEAGVPVDPRVGKKVAGRSVTKAGVRREAFDEWRQSLTTS